MAPTMSCLKKRGLYIAKKINLKVSRNAQPTCVDGANGSFIRCAFEMYFKDEDIGKLEDFNYATSGEHYQLHRIYFKNGVVIWGIRLPNENERLYHKL